MSTSTCIACTLAKHSGSVAIISFLLALKKYPEQTTQKCIDELCVVHSAAFDSGYNRKRVE